MSLLTAAGGTGCSQQGLFPLPGTSIALPKHPAATPALERGCPWVCQHRAGSGGSAGAACVSGGTETVCGAGRAASGKALSSPLSARASLRPFLCVSHLSWGQECPRGPAQRPKAAGAVSCGREPGQQDTSPCCTSALALQGRSWGRLCLFPQLHTFHRLAWLLPWAWECCWAWGSAVGLRQKLWMELFPLEPKLTTHFSLFPVGSAGCSFPPVLQALAWLALEPGTTAGWGGTAQSQPPSDSVGEVQLFNGFSLQRQRCLVAVWLRPCSSSAEFGRGQGWINSIRKGLIPQDEFPSTGENISSFSSQLVEWGGKGKGLCYECLGVQTLSPPHF